MDLKTLGARIKEAREEADLSQEKLGEMIGIKTQGGVGHWETGRRAIPADKLMRLMEILGKPPEFFLVPDRKGQSLVPANHPRKDLIHKALAVLDSCTPWANILVADIEKFFSTVMKDAHDRAVEDRLSRIEEHMLGSPPAESPPLTGPGNSKIVDFRKPGRGKKPTRPRGDTTGSDT